jgi:hypothetical protein
MRILFERVDSHAELLEQLKRNSTSVLLGSDDEATKEFYRAATSHGVIGVCSQGHGISPFGFVDEANEEGWIGYSSNVANIDLRRCHTRFAIRLDGVFFSMLSQMADGSVIVVHELGVCRVSRSGELIWSCATDVVTDFSDSGDFVRIQTDEAMLLVDKEGGQKR